jgi:tRNA isopentenyl-2-thiomethyl-A-37 hydroxylase MiaE
MLHYVEQNIKANYPCLNFTHKEETNMKTQQFQKALTFALPLEHFEQIKEITDVRQISIAEWVRDAVAMALNNIKREEDTM